MTTDTNIAGAIVSTDPRVCTACKLAKMLETGVMSVSIDAGHSECEGSTDEPCYCGCDYSRRQACKDCGRKGTALSPESHCVDRRDCANALLARIASDRKARADRAAAAPARRSPGGKVGADCRCGCGEKTGGGMYRPGHDARHISQLVARVKSGELTLQGAQNEVQHSAALVAKLTKAAG